jgi:nucleotide-binding universal stress UspA family protein
MWMRPARRKSAAESNGASPAEDQNVIPERQWKQALVPAIDMPYSMRSLRVAFRLAQDTGAVVKLAFVVEVPRALQLDASLPDLEAVAESALGEAEEEARGYSVRVEPFIHRTRSAADGILKLIHQEGIDLLILGSRPDGVRGLPSELTRELFQRAACEVVLDYIADEK